MREQDETRLGRCYELAGLRMTDGLLDEKLTLVHGTIGPNKNPHAWVEYESDGIADWNEIDTVVVWEPTGDQVWPRTVFYALFYAEVQSTYDYETFRKWTLQTGHWGPWEGSYWIKYGKRIAAQ